MELTRSREAPEKGHDHRFICWGPPDCWEEVGANWGDKESLDLNGWHSTVVPPSGSDTQNGVRLLRRNQYSPGRRGGEAGQQEAMMGCESL